jgi:hypothetical protein
MIVRARRPALLAALTLGLCLLPAAPALATFHLMQVREVYPGSAASPDAEYVELQMWSPGQNLVGGHVLRSYAADGTPFGTSTFPGNLPNSANQSTMLLATPQAEAEFGVVADAPISPSGQLSPAGGALCWEAIDCVSWGSFSGSLPSPAGSPAAPGGIPDGMALRRSLARGCATALDPADDSDQSAADFEAVFASPRPNSVPPSEQTCAGSIGGGGVGPTSDGDHPPQTTLRRKPPKRSHDRTPTFRFVASEAGAHFECKLDHKRFRSCASPLTTRRLAFGAHRFGVRAIGHGGAKDPTPAAYRFRILAPQR